MPTISTRQTTSPIVIRPKVEYFCYFLTRSTNLFAQLQLIIIKPQKCEFLVMIFRILSTSEEPRRICLIMILWDVGFAGYFVTFCLFVDEIS